MSATDVAELDIEADIEVIVEMAEDLELIELDTGVELVCPARFWFPIAGVPDVTVLLELEAAEPDERLVNGDAVTVVGPLVPLVSVPV